MIKINKITVDDVRFPTSEDLTGSDAIHSDPDYSAAYVTIYTSESNLKGYGMAFTIGKGNDIVAECVKHFFPLFIGLSLDEVEKNIGKLWYDCVDHSQLRWLGPEKGVVHMATAAIFNALWDLIAKKNNKPLWRYVIDQEPDQIMNWLVFKYIEDTLSKDEAYNFLVESQKYKSERINNILQEGYPSYTTAAGWIGYSNDKIVELCKRYTAMGWKHFKVKVGTNIDEDVKRLEIIRNTIGNECSIMVDVNQQWSIDQAIKHINAYKKFDLLFVEEPTSPDDVIGFKKIKDVVGNIKLATGEACESRIMFKQFFELQALDVCQIDSCRLGSINEIVTILLMANKFNIPVFPHAGGVGLCEYVQHLCMIDYVLVTGKKDDKLVEYADSLHEHFVYPCKVNNGNYMPPLDSGYSIEMKSDSVKTFLFPDGEYWSKKKA
ncbi:MAG: L-fuconate dehydratase [Alphaproteobacteria bacterium MarineAlpha5_Bin6]|nr:MAG: L-fuconate dehydratase [Alphaproteobacteria bacterium MarineAlpha5_Bin7]PPR54834.1 MAG: L-fuconate dehydratase [Alphaproteobacteria bacterium MarineAlpha5_Bin6]|tara:strand:+ start:946 stop:2250 length:1305 start_codon:yes stop_codon:yes gene_type:complete